MKIENISSHNYAHSKMHKSYLLQNLLFSRLEFISEMVAVKQAMVNFFLKNNFNSFLRAFKNYLRAFITLSFFIENARVKPSLTKTIRNFQLKYLLRKTFHIKYKIPMQNNELKE